MRVNLWISDHWKVENHKAKVDAIEDMFVNRKTVVKWDTMYQSYSQVLLKQPKKNIKQAKKFIFVHKIDKEDVKLEEN